MKENRIPLKELLPVIQEVLASGGEFLLHPQGVSMLPYLCEGRDSVMLCAVTGTPRRGDILLYRRLDGTLVLHRVVKVERDGTLSMRGDNQYFVERGIREAQVIATVSRVVRNGKEHATDGLSAHLYRTRRALSYPFRRVGRAAARRFKRLFQRGK